MGWRKGSINISGVSASYFYDECVYEPSDDTEVAAEAIVKLPSAGLLPEGGVQSVLELGSGTGVLAALAAKVLRPLLVAAVDVSPHAAEATRLTLGDRAMVVQCYAGRCLRGRWDLVIVNPPYLPAPLGELRDDRCGGWIPWSWSEEAGHAELCESAASLGNYVLMVRSSLERFDVDRCMALHRLYRTSTLAERRTFMETLRAELWAKS